MRVDTVVVSSQHAKDISLDAMLTPDVKKHVVDHGARDVRHPLRRLPAAGQPDRPLRGRRPDGRRRPDRPQDHRRHLRRHGPPRRRRVLRQGPVEGGPLRGVRDALGGQEHRRRRAWPAAARCRSPTRSARRSRSASTSTASAPSRSRSARSRRPSSRSSTSGRPRSSPTSTCSARSTPRAPRTATSAASSGLHLGAHRPRRRAQAGRRGLTLAGLSRFVARARDQLVVFSL